MNFETGMNCPCLAKCSQMENEKKKNKCENDCDKECSKPDVISAQKRKKHFLIETGKKHFLIEVEDNGEMESTDADIGADNESDIGPDNGSDNGGDKRSENGSEEFKEEVDAASKSSGADSLFKSAQIPVRNLIHSHKFW